MDNMRIAVGGDLNVTNERRNDKVKEWEVANELTRMPLPGPTRPKSNTTPDSVHISDTISMDDCLIRVLGTFGSDHAMIMVDIPHRSRGVVALDTEDEASEEEKGDSEDVEGEKKQEKKEKKKRGRPRKDAPEKKASGDSKSKSSNGGKKGGKKKGRRVMVNNYAKANWELYRKIAKEELGDEEGNRNRTMEQLAKKLKNAMKKASKGAIPRGVLKRRKYRMRGLTPEAIAVLSERKLTAREKRLIRSRARQGLRDELADKVLKTNFRENGASKAHKIAEEFEGKGNDRIEKPLIEGNRMICDNEEKAEVFAKFYTEAHVPSQKVEKELQKMQEKNNKMFNELPQIGRDQQERDKVGVAEKIQILMSTRKRTCFWRKMLMMTQWMAVALLGGISVDPGVAVEMTGNPIQNYLTAEDPTANSRGKVSTRLKVSDSEARIALSSLKGASADEYSTQQWRNLPGAGAKVIRQTAQMSIDTGEILPGWLQGTVTPIVKPGKEPSKKESRRPVQISHTLGRLAERVVIGKFEKHVGSSENQYGHTAGRAGEHLALSSATKAHQHVNGDDVPPEKRKDRAVAGICYDFSSAFDRLPIDPVTREMMLQGKPGESEENRMERIYLVRWIRNFSVNRELRVKCGGEFSGCRSINGGRIGCPQGSSVGPMSWKVFIRGLEKELDKIRKDHEFDYHVFADDVSVMVPIERRKSEEWADALLRASGLAQKITNAISKWAEGFRK
jgi:hypothetical protein